MEGSERGLHMVIAAGVQSQKQQAIMGARLHPCPLPRDLKDISLRLLPHQSVVSGFLWMTALRVLF